MGGLAIEILPKAERRPSHDGTVWREGLLEMLRVALNLRLAKPSSASQRSGPSPLLHIIAERFCEELSLLLHGGLAKAYRREEANGPAFRGKLVFASHIRANAARGPLLRAAHEVRP